MEKGELSAQPQVGAGNCHHTVDGSSWPPPSSAAVEPRTAKTSLSLSLSSPPPPPPPTGTVDTDFTLKIQKRLAVKELYLAEYIPEILFPLLHYKDYD